MKLTEDQKLHLKVNHGIVAETTDDLNEAQKAEVEKGCIKLLQAWIGENQTHLDWYREHRDLVFKLRGWDSDDWKSKLSLFRHPPTGKLLALWLLPQQEIGELLTVKN